MPTIVAVVTDLFFAVKVSDGAKHANRDVKFAGTIDQAIQFARNERPVMIVADLHCREVDCLELARQLEADPELSGIPLLGFSSHVQEDLKRAALTAGFDKVVARSTFSDKVRQLLAG
jgi:CheY-like chemotaxis protein